MKIEETATLNGISQVPSDTVVTPVPWQLHLKGTGKLKVYIVKAIVEKVLEIINVRMNAFARSSVISFVMIRISMLPR